VPEGSARRRISEADRVPLTTGIEPGTVIADRYRIEALLGEGGMGKVYRAEHVHMRKLVAVKVLHNDVTTTPEVVARFEREAVAAGNISHPHVASATDFGQLEDGSFFLVLELVPGSDLRTVVKEGPVPAERAVRIVRQIVAAVGAAHAAGIVHRDLKPENIMLVEGKNDDFVKVLDFGIAKLDSVGMVDPDGKTQAPTTGPQPLTRLGAVFGTPDYMSPEQALGQPIDARADLYSIGVILYELLSGERPFRGGAVSLMRKHVLQDAPPLPPSVAEVRDPRLQAIITKLLQKSPNERYADAAELGVALDELSTVAPGGSDASSALSPPPRTRSTVATLPALGAERPRKTRSGLWVLLVMVALGVGAFTWLRYRSVAVPWAVATAPWIGPVFEPSAGTARATTVPTSAPAASSVATAAGGAASDTARSPGSASPSAAAAAAPAPIPSASAAAPGDSATPAPSASASGSASASASGAAPASSAGAEDARSADTDEMADEPEEPSKPSGTAPRAGVAQGPAGARHGAHAPAHSGSQRHKAPPHSNQPPPRHTGPGGIYVPPPSQWFK
jgi:serine/threonine protein kinase